MKKTTFLNEFGFKRCKLDQNYKNNIKLKNSFSKEGKEIAVKYKFT